MHAHGEQQRRVLSALLQESGKLAMEMGSRVGKLKNDGTLVTQADRACEALLATGLEKLFPDDAIVGEEGHESGERAGRVWYVDPIDGTQAFREGLAHWGPSIGAVDRDGPLLGASHFPMLSQTWFFMRGQGAYLDGARLERLQDRPVDRQSSAFMPSGWFRYFDLRWPGRVRNLGSISSHLALVAGGGVSAAFIPAGWKKWDVAAGLGLLAEVGAWASPLSGDAYGSPLDAVHSGGKPFVVGSPEAAFQLKAGLSFHGSRNSGGR
jgi:myo-inositol-1(or 4)-monophosphatase